MSAFHIVVLVAISIGYAGGWFAHDIADRWQLWRRPTDDDFDDFLEKLRRLG